MSDKTWAIIVIILLILSLIFICIGVYNIFTVETCKGFVWTLIVGLCLFGVGVFAAYSVYGSKIPTKFGRRF